jgi:integrase
LLFLYTPQWNNLELPQGEWQFLVDTMIRAADTPTLSEFFERTYLPVRLVGAADGTVENYRQALTHWRRICGETPVAKVNSISIATFQRGLSVGRSEATVNGYTRPIMAMLRLAADDDFCVIDRAPKVRMLREPKRSPLAITVEEFAKVLAAARSWPRSIAGYQPIDWWDAVLLTDWETGLRLEALFALRSVDLLWDDRGLFSQAEDAKDKEAAWHELQPATLDAIRKIYDPRRELLFPRRVQVKTIGRWFREILDASGIYAPKGCGMRFHRLRRSKASYTELAGGDAQRALGHSARSVTLRYLDPRIVGRAKQPAMPMP